MSSYNHATFIGNLGREPELRYTPQGHPICSFTMAVNDRKKVNGEWTEATIWVKVNVWGRQAESASQYLSKGRPCLVEGRLSIEEWVDKEQRPRFTLVMTANSVTFLGDKPQGASSSPSGKSPASAPSIPPAAVLQEPISDDDIPF